MVTIGYALQSFTNLAALSAADANDYFRLGAVLNCLGAFIAAGTLMRLAFQGDPAEPRFRIGPAGFQLGRMELRLLVATLGCLVVVLCYVLLIAALSAAAVAGAASIRDVSNDLNSVSDAVRIFTAPGAIVAAASFAVAGAGLVVVMTRLVLVAPATADSAEIRLLSTWRYTRGVFWPIFLSNLAVQIVVWGTFALEEVSRGIAGELLSSGSTLVLNLAVSGISGLILGFVSLPMVAGLQVYFYDRLVGRAAVSSPADERGPEPTPASG